MSNLEDDRRVSITMLKVNVKISRTIKIITKSIELTTKLKKNMYKIIGGSNKREPKIYNTLTLGLLLSSLNCC
jgi:hypothetical protein